MYIHDVHFSTSAHLFFQLSLLSFNLKCILYSQITQLITLIECPPNGNRASYFNMIIPETTHAIQVSGPTFVDMNASSVMKYNLLRWQNNWFISPGIILTTVLNGVNLFKNVMIKILRYSDTASDSTEIEEIMASVSALGNSPFWTESSLILCSNLGLHHS